MIELEKTYLAKSPPKGLKDCKSKEIIDIYVPRSSEHPVLRIRKNGEKFEVTKKYPVWEGDSSVMHEHTIPLTEGEFNILKSAEGKKVSKIRYYYPLDNGRLTAEIDVFQEALKGLVLVDVEFVKEAEKEAFEMPDFCLAEVTQEEFIAGGMLCGRSYDDIEKSLAKFGYKKLFLE
jgi:CYTH domain-containing protein